MSATTFWFIIGMFLIGLLLGALIDISLVPVFYFLAIAGHFASNTRPYGA